MTNSITIGITGANGHIGSHLVAHLRSKGFLVIRLLRDPDPLDDWSRKYDLTSKINDGLLRGIDILIHCAYVSEEETDNAAQINYDGSKALFEACRREGVKKILFFSSVTADETAVSGYAKSKFAIQQLLNEEKDFVIRCSMVVGSGGLFRKMLDYATTRKIVPVIGAGKQIVQVIAIEDVERFVEHVIVYDLSGTGVLASKEELTYKEIFLLIAKVYSKQILFIHLPAGMLKLMLQVFRLLHVRTSASAENIEGLQHLKRHEPLILFDSFRSLEEKLVQLRDG